MHKNPKLLIFVFLLCVFLSETCTAAESITKINDLIENATALDNTVVTVQGEVIGEALERGDYVWLNITDTTNAIGIWVKKDDIAQIQFYGDYKHKGDILRITGIFSRACTEHGGDVDIHCSIIEVTEPGYVIKEQISRNKFIITLIAIVFTAVILIIYLKIKEQRVYNK